MSSPAKASRMRESPFDAALADISEGKWSRYQKKFVPVENQLIKRVDQMGEQSQIDLAGSLAETGVSRQLNPAISGAERGLAMKGIGANSGAFVAKEAEMRAAGADAMATAGVGAKMGQQTRHLEGLKSLMGIGNNQSTDAQVSMSRLASLEADKARSNLEFKTDEDAAMGGAIGTVAGMGIRGAVQAAR